MNTQEIEKLIERLRERCPEYMIEALIEEVEEQCRLNGMGSEREAKLLAENQKLKDLLGYDWNMLEATQESLRDAQQTIEDQRKLYANCVKVAKEKDELDRIATDLQVLCDKQANYAAKLEQELAMLKAGMEMGGT